MVPNIRRQLRRFAPQFVEAREKSLNEADTVDRLHRFVEKVLGYDPSEDIGREAQMKHKFVDLCLKIDGTIQLLVEAKAANVQLRDRHIDQAWMYASQNNYRWVVLTNGVEWRLYHLTFDEGIEYEPAFVASLETEEGIEHAAKSLALLHKQSVRKGELEKFWEKASALCAASIGKALFTDSVLRVLRREIRKSCGVLIDPEDLAKATHELLNHEAREEIGPARIRRRRRKKAIAGSKSATAKKAWETRRRNKPISNTSIAESVTVRDKTSHDPAVVGQSQL
jgi:hypothetical protein